MTVKELLDSCGFTAAVLTEPDREIDGAYVGDLLSWVMGRAAQDNVWITIMSNINVVAVASLADVACVVVAEGVDFEEEILKTAEEKGVNILLSDKPSFETALMISEYI